MMTKLKFVLKLWICVWILVTSINLAIKSTGLVLPMALHSLIVCTVMVPTMVFVIMPFLTRPAR